MLPKKDRSLSWWYPWWVCAIPIGTTLLLAFLVFGVPSLIKTSFPEPPPTEVERFISGDALVKNGLRLSIYVDKYYDLQEYTRRGDVPGLTEVYTWLQSQGYHNPGETDAGGPEDTRVWCEFGRLHGDFCLECTRLVSTENPKSYGVGMELNLKTHEHMGEGVNFELFQQAYPKAVKALSQPNLGMLPMVK